LLVDTERLLPPNLSSKLSWIARGVCQYVIHSLDSVVRTSTVRDLTDINSQIVIEIAKPRVSTAV